MTARVDDPADHRQPAAPHPAPPSDQLVTGRDAARRWVRHVWWTAGAAGAGLGAAVWVVTPHGREINAVWELGAKLVAYAALGVAIAFFPWVNGRLHWLLYAPLLVFTGYVIPRISFLYYTDADRAHGDTFYTHLYFLLYPGIVLTVAAAHRLGGGSPGRCLQIAVSGVIIVFSGFLDLMWWLINPVAIPDQIDAPHINLFTGGPISFGRTILFALAHLPVLVAVNLLPLDRWLARLTGAAGGHIR